MSSFTSRSIRPDFLPISGAAATIGVELTALETIPAGSVLSLRGGNFRSVYQLWTCPEMDASEVIDVLQPPPHDFMSMQRSHQGLARQNHRMLVVQLKRDLASGETLRLVIEGHAFWQAPLMTWLQPYLALPGGEEQPCGERFEMMNHPGELARIECRAKVSPLADGTHSVVVFATDALLNPSPDFNQPVQFNAVAGVEGLPAVATPDATGRIFLEGLRVTSPRPVRLNVRTSDGRLRATSNYLVPEGFFPLLHAMGEIHFHCVYSTDGDRTQAQAYEYARDTLNLDMASLSDHTPRDYWQQTLDCNDQFNEDHRFVTLHGWEWSTRLYGHVNFYLRHRDIAAGPTGYKHDQHPATFDWPEDVVGIPHHTNIRAHELDDDGNPYWSEYDWHTHHPCFLACEINQSRGNFEDDTIDPKWKIATGAIGASVRDALARGYRIGFTSGTDNHIAFPTREGGNENPIYIGMTGFLCPERTRDAVWLALRDRHTYGTTGVPIACHFEVAGRIMGDVLTVSSTSPLPARIAFYATDRITDVELISEGKTVRSFPLDGSDSFDLTLELPIPSGPHPYYYVRMRQNDGHLAWTSPIYFTSSSGAAE